MVSNSNLFLGSLNHFRRKTREMLVALKLWVGHEASPHGNGFSASAGQAQPLLPMALLWPASAAPGGGAHQRQRLQLCKGSRNSFISSSHLNQGLSYTQNASFAPQGMQSWAGGSISGGSGCWSRKRSVMEIRCFSRSLPSLPHA